MKCKKNENQMKYGNNMLQNDYFGRELKWKGCKIEWK
jgi:hypothetical protein